MTSTIRFVPYFQSWDLWYRKGIEASLWRRLSWDIRDEERHFACVCLVFEPEPESEKILFRWVALEYLSVSEAKYPLLDAGNKSVSFDYFHINSIVNIDDSFHVNARHIWVTYLVSVNDDVSHPLRCRTFRNFDKFAVLIIIHPSQLILFKRSWKLKVSFM